MKFQGTDIQLELDEGAKPFSKGPYCRLRDWCFPSGLHWGKAWLFWVEEDGEFQRQYDTFCEAWREAPVE